MHEDYVVAARELSRLRSDLRSVRTDGDVEQLARLAEVAELLTMPGVAADAAACIAERTLVEYPRVERACVKWIERHARKAITRFLRDLRDVGDSFPDEIRAHLHAAPIMWLGEETTTGRALASLEEARSWDTMLLEDAKLLETKVWAAACLCLADIRKTVEKRESDRAELVARLRAVHDDAVRVAELLGSLRGQALLMYRTARASDHGAALADLKALANALEHVRAGVADENAGHLHAISHRLADVVLATDSLLSATSSRLALGPVEVHVLRRLKTVIERWERIHLLPAMLASPSRAESILQDFVDRFLFREGLYPITHAVAGSGEIDTFVVENQPLFEELKRQPRQPAILIELKQTASLEPNASGEKRLRELIARGQSQAREYAAHLKANAAWRDHEVFCVVAYGGTQRYELVSGPRTILIYLGESPPSKGAKPL